MGLGPAWPSSHLLINQGLTHESVCEALLQKTISLGTFLSPTTFTLLWPLQEPTDGFWGSPRQDSTTLVLQHLE